MKFSLRPKPAPPGDVDHPKPIPDIRANFFSKVVFAWCFPLLQVGFSRPLEAEDLYELDKKRLSGTIADTLEKEFYSRVPPERKPRHLRGSQSSSSESDAEEANEKPTVTPDTTSISSSDDKKETQATTKEEEDDNDEYPPATLPNPVTMKVLTSDEKKAADKHNKKYPGNAEGGRVIGSDGKSYDQSLLWALSRAFWWPVWSSAVFLIFSSLLQTFAPLVTKRLLSYLTTSYAWSRYTPAERDAMGLTQPSVGEGIGLAFGVFLMQEAASLAQNQYMQRGMTVGFLMRSSLIALISRKSLRLSGSARVKHPNGHLITLVSSDCSFMDWAGFLVHCVWVQPIQILIGMALLIWTLGYSALVGCAVLLLNAPMQALLVRTMFKTRQGQLKVVDKRVRLLQEVLNGIRVIKLYAFENFFKTRLAGFRQEEMDKLKKISLVRATMTGSMSFVPILAAILSFITYSLSGHDLNVALIFSSLQLFNVIKVPLMMLPMAFNVSSDALVALKRIATALLAEELANDMKIDSTSPSAIRAYGTFAWETNGPPGGIVGKGGGRGGRDFGVAKAKKAAAKAAKKDAKERKKKGLPAKEEIEEKGKGKQEAAPFRLKGIDIEIPRGSLTAIVGSVGSGKSSLLQALIGEMRRVSGDVVFGGTTAYAPQAPWVQNATLRDNILFGLNEDPDRFDEVIHACSLQADIDILPAGLETEIGEKGINLSGGQKARVSLARAVYFDADVILLDDPLSAVDAHVSNHIIENCLVDGPLKGKTRFLVTHQLDVLKHADHIIVMNNGRISEQGSYPTLLASGQAFTKLVEEYGSSKKDEEKKIEGEEEEEVGDVKKDVKKNARGVAGPGLIESEERETGSVSWGVYAHYAKSMGSVVWAPLIFVVYILAQCATVGNTIFLGFWSEQNIRGFDQGDYMGVYAAFGIAAGIFSFAGTFLIYLRGISASYALFNEALGGVMRSRVAWFDVTPIGRITSRMSKDITTLDNQLPMQWNQLLTLVFSVLGTIGLVIYTFNWLGIMFVPLFIVYYSYATFYRASSREVKRLDSLLRSFIYTNYGEMLGGLASVRAYRCQGLFTAKTEHSIDVENRAYYMTITLQRWLGVRLDFLGNLLVLAIALFGVGFRDTVNPSKLGVVLTYSLSVTQSFSQIVSVFATVEQDMNTAERVSHYARLTPEAAVETANDPPKDWPPAGSVEFKDVRLAYREGLPEVLKGVSFTTRPGEKVGIVGRTGAGKSSLLQALFRIVELSGGQIKIDDVDTSTIGLDVLRKSLAVIPQDPLLYAGTVRDNLDVIGDRTDQELNSALRRAGLYPPDGASEDEKERFAKFKLDAVVNDDGSNFSGGERQLIALVRALVKNSRVIVLDEATSQVDVETDAAIQQTIQKEFGSQTLLCIAHRLATIAFYDRVLVLDFGQVVEFDEPLVLFDKVGGIFRGMCDKASLTREDIVRIRLGAGKNV